MDQWGHHGLSCKKSRGRQGRHSALNESIQRALGSAKVTSILEPPGLDRGDNKRPYGLTIYPWKFGKPLVWDVSRGALGLINHVLVLDAFLTTSVLFLSFRMPLHF